MITSFDDDVNGTIVGGDYLMCRLVYDGRTQKEFLARTDDEALQVAKHWKSEIMSSCGLAVGEIYPEDKWKLRIAD